mgnify:CR=1 FL=1
MLICTKAFLYKTIFFYTKGNQKNRIFLEGMFSNKK